MLISPAVSWLVPKLPLLTPACFTVIVALPISSVSALPLNLFQSVLLKYPSSLVLAAPSLDLILAVVSSPLFVPLVLASFVFSAAVTNLCAWLVSSTKSASNLLVLVISVCNHAIKSPTGTSIVVPFWSVSTIFLFVLS